MNHPARLIRPACRTTSSAFAGVATALLTGLLASGCTATGESTTLLADAHAGDSGQSSATSPADSPESDRDRARREAWEDAISGIVVRDGRLTVTERLAATERVSADADAADARDTNRRTRYVAARVRAVRATPRDGTAWNDLGDAFVMAGRLELAEAAFATAAGATDDVRITARAGRATAMIAAQRGDFASAARTMDAALALEPDGAGHARMAVWMMYLEDLEAARRHAAEAERLGGRVPAAIRGRLGG